jgi:hypothetical protein
MQALLALLWSEHMDGLTLELPIFLLATFAGALALAFQDLRSVSSKHRSGSTFSRRCKLQR